jgi:hypothetical protein
MSCRVDHNALTLRHLLSTLVLLMASAALGANEGGPTDTKEYPDRSATSLAWENPTDASAPSRQASPPTADKRPQATSGDKAAAAAGAATATDTPPPPQSDNDDFAFLRRDTPKMFGHLFFLGGNLFAEWMGMDVGATDLPLGGGAGRLSIAENNSPIPDDRVYFTYNHFADAFVTDGFFGQGRRVLSLDRYTLGFEKTLRDRLWSVETRLPLTNDLGADVSGLSASGGNLGNIAVITKRILYQTDDLAVAGGLGMDLPTGTDAAGEVSSWSYRVRNRAVHLSPYLGLVRTPNDRLFYQGFLQVDVPLNGNPVECGVIGAPSLASIGDLQEQTLMHLDAQGGFWLYHNASASWVTGLASIVEVHYVTTLNDAPELQYYPGGMMALTFGNSASRINLVDLTVGLHAEIRQNTTCRIAAVFPLQAAESGVNRGPLVRSAENRAFDSEIVVQIERRF